MSPPQPTSAPGRGTPRSVPRHARPLLTLLLATVALAPACNAPGDKTCESACPPDTAGSSSSGDPTTGAPTTGTTGEPTSTATDASSGGSSGPPPSACDGDFPRVRLSTSMGDMVVMLDAVKAPVTVANFLHYVETGFYAGTIFHRVIDDFVVQGGGFTADGVMRPTDPPIPLEIIPGATHVDGAIGMARTNDPDSATSQFYLCDGPQPGLDGDYAMFGAVVEGFDVLAAISAVATDANDVPLEDVVLLSATCE